MIYEGNAEKNGSDYDFRRFNIAFAGRAGSGKDTAANYLIERYGYRKISFAEPVKRICKGIFDWPDDDPRWREAYQRFGTDFGRLLDPEVWIKHFKETLSFEHNEQCLRAMDFKKCNLEYANKLFLCRPKYTCTKNLFNFACTDVRFPNEAQWLIDNGWLVVVVQTATSERIERLGKRDGNVNIKALNHKSELCVREIQSLPGVKMIFNNGTIPELYAEVENLLRR